MTELDEDKYDHIGSALHLPDRFFDDMLILGHFKGSWREYNPSKTGSWVTGKELKLTSEEKLYLSMKYL
jgi:hypothetical protein